MRHQNYSPNPSFTSELGALAGLYRTVFWMMGRKARYGRLWPPEAEMPPLDEAAPAAPSPSPIEPHRSHLVEAGSRR